MQKFYLTLIFICSLHLIGFSQSDSAYISAIAGKLQKLSAKHPAEKVYLHFNKPSYIIGDTIWFKGYVTVGTHHQPSILSGVLYVELINNKDKVIQSLQLKSNNGISAGDFALSEKLQPGNYRVRAYTNWMRNFGADYFFNQSIAVNNIETDAVLISPSYSAGANETINTKLAYTDKLGRPYEHREVGYEVRADSNLLYKAKGVTDASGNLSFTFPGQTAPGQQVNLTSHFKLASGVIINKTVSLNIVNGNSDVQFFPEGGQLVNGVRSRIAFKAIGSNGLGVEVKGVVLDNENNEVAEFSSQHLGMGVFALTPQSGKIYTAKITMGGNLVKTIKLPLANDRGFVLAVNNSPGDTTKLSIRIATNEVTLNEKKGQSFYIIGQTAGVVYYTTAGKLDNASFTAVVPKANFPSGLAQFTLFSGNDEPLNERVVFIQNNTDILNMNINSSKATYAAKEKTSLTFNANDNNSKPVQGHFSLSVYKEDETTTNESSILSNILLTADLKGHIEQPGYYFNNSNNQAKANLDVLLLTQGYRRFDWKEALADQYQPLAYQPETGLSISGQLTTSSGKPIARGKISALSVADALSIDTTANDQGRFVLANLNFTDTTNLLIQARKDNDDKNVTIKINANTSPLIYKNTFTDADINSLPTFLNTAPAVAGKADTIQITSQIKRYNTFLKNTKELKEVVVNQRKNAGTELAPWIIVSPHSSNLNGPGHADRVFSSKDLENCVDFFECVINKIPGIDRMLIKKDTVMDGAFYRGGDEVDFFTRHRFQSLTHPPSIYYMLDGVPVKPDDIRYLNVNAVASVEVLSSGGYLSIYGSAAAGGMIIITTKLGNEDPGTDYNAQAAPGVITTKFKGFYQAKAFYTPKYTVTNQNVTDNRTAVYWNPNVTTDATGNFPVEYFNSDIKGTYKAVVEGIDNDGNIGRFVYKYKVE